MVPRWPPLARRGDPPDRRQHVALVSSVLAPELHKAKAVTVQVNKDLLIQNQHHKMSGPASQVQPRFDEEINSV